MEMLQNRIEILNALVKVTMPISEAVARLTKLPWDSESELVALTPDDICHILTLFKQGGLSAAEVEDWANALECREDVHISSSVGQLLLHELANPLLTYPLTNDRANFWLGQLRQ